MLMAIKCDLFLHVNDTCQAFEIKNVKNIKKQLNENTGEIWHWLNKLNTHFSENETKPILFNSEHKIKKI